MSLSNNNFKMATEKNDLDMVYPPIPEGSNFWQKFKLKLHHSILVSEDHPRTLEYFQSEVAILNEKKRHYNHFKYSIHPLSKFNQIYELWSFFFYGFAIFFKVFEFAFISIHRGGPFKSDLHLIGTALAVDLTSLVNILIQFWIGYRIEHSGRIELSKSKILLRYLTSGYFFCDLFSSIPRILSWRSNSTVFVIMLSLTLLKLRRTATFIRLLKPTAMFFGIKSSTVTFVFGFCFIAALVTHVMTCLQAGIPRYRTSITLSIHNKSYLTPYMLSLPRVRQYLITFFKGSEYTFHIEIPRVRGHGLPEELTFCIMNYIVGKIFITVIWVVLLYTFMSQRILKIKYEEVMTELKEYMIAKQLPTDLKSKLITYYNFKYQKVFFNELYIRQTILSENLKKEMDVFLCKSLIKKVSIFSQLSSKVVKEIVAHLVPEIYLPSHFIIQSATFGDCMYFIESGTVAVYTHSGREVCHLHDGSYFGEVSILMKQPKRNATIIAIEITKIYKLSKKQFENSFLKHENVYNAILEQAKKRIELINEVETKYKKLIFEQTYTNKLSDTDIDI